MQTKRRLSSETVLDGAVELVNEKGPDALSLAELAARFRVRPPSLYNHVNGLDGLRHGLALRGLEGLAETMRGAAAGRSGFDAVRAVAQAYRNFAHAQPGVYPFTLRAPAADDQDLENAANAVLDVVLASLRGYGLEGDAAIHAARVLRSALHGFVSLELSGGFGLPQGIDESFDHLLLVQDRGLRDWSAGQAGQAR